MAQQHGDGEERSQGGRVSVKDLNTVAEEVIGLKRISFQHVKLE